MGADNASQPASNIAGQQAVQFANYARLLANEPIRKDLGFTPQQTEALQQAFQTYGQQQQKQEQEYPNPQGLSADDRQKFEAQAFKIAEQFGQQLAQIVTAEQTEQLEQINFRLAAYSVLANPAAAQELGLTQEQRQQVEKIQQDLQNQLWQIQHQAAKDSVQVLNAEQLTKLRNLQQRGFRQPPQSAAPGKPQPVRPAQ